MGNGESLATSIPYVCPLPPFTRDRTKRKWYTDVPIKQLDDKLPSLGEQGLTDLRATNADSGPVDTVSSATNHYDRALELKRLAKSLLLNFLELVSTLSHAPASAEAKIDDLNTLFMNMHHVLNEYRPHQARESAIELMQTHLDRVRGETAAVRAQVDKARSVLEGLGSLRVEEDEEGGGKTGAGHEEEVRRKAEEGEREKVLVDREAEVWGALDSACA